MLARSVKASKSRARSASRRLFKTLARILGGVRRGEVPTVDEMFLKACGIDTEEAAWLSTNTKH
jgi:hypothetical protein